MARAINKKEAIKLYAETYGLKLKEAEKQLNNVYEFIMGRLMAGDAVRIKGVGTLRKVDRPARECRVPGTNTVVNVGARFTFKLKGKTYDAE